jgi:AcrR family transcriptional regulator
VAPLPRDRTGGARAPRPGHDGHGNDRIVAIQHARIVAAMVAVVAEHGAAGATVSRVVGRASVSRRTFYELFESSEDCFLAALEGCVEAASAPVLDAYRGGGSWQERIRASLRALLEFLDHEPDAGRLMVVHSLGGGPRALACRERSLAPSIAAVNEGGAHVKRGVHAPPPIAAEGAVGAVLAILHSRLLALDGQPLSGLLSPLTSMLVLPYLGRAAARRELERPAPPHKPRAVNARPDPLSEVPVRITQRTVAVLSAIAEHPGASNRRIGEAAGVVDQGQMSKLLHRLRERGLVTNDGAIPTKGAPNAWTLTPAGAEIERATNLDGARGRRHRAAGNGS